MTTGGANLRVYVKPEYRVSHWDGQRVLRLSWCVANLGVTAFVGPHRTTNNLEFTATQYGYPAVRDVWGLTLINESNKTSMDFVGSAYVAWDSRALTGSPAIFSRWFRDKQTGISPLAEAAAPGFMTSFPLGNLPDGDYLALFSFDPTDKWGACTFADEFRIRIEAMSALPIDIPQPTSISLP